MHLDVTLIDGVVDRFAVASPRAKVYGSAIDKRPENIGQLLLVYFRSVPRQQK